MRDRPRLLLDIDGVFANFIDRALVAIHAVTGRHADAKHDDCTTYAMEIAFGLSKEERDKWFALIRARDYCSSIPTYPGSRECVERMSKVADIYPLTYPFPRAPWWLIEREDWMRDQLGLDPDRVVYTRRKYVAAGDILVEDTTTHLIEWKKHHRDGLGIRIARPYNVNEPFDGPTVDSFAALALLIETRVEELAKHQRDLWDSDQ